MSAYTQAVLAGAQPGIKDWHEFLIAFHRVFPDVTTRSLALLSAPGGVDAYKYFAERVRELAPATRSVLDVGCGEGSLLLALRENFGKALRLAGVDLSEDEIALARERVPHAALRCGDIAKVKYPSASFEAVVGHLSFALIPNMRALFRTIARALTPGGLLAFVIEDPLAESTIFRAIASSRLSIRQRHPAFAPTVPQREAWEDDEVVRALLRGSGFLSDVTIERFALEARLTPEELWEIARRSYSIGLLESDLQDMVRPAMHDSIVVDERDGRVAASLPLRLIAARR